MRIITICLLMLTLSTNALLAGAAPLDSAVEIFQTTRQGDRLAPVEIKEASESAPDRTLKLDPSKTFQTLVGIGSSFTESSAYVLSELSQKSRDEVLKPTSPPTGPIFR